MGAYDKYCVNCYHGQLKNIFGESAPCTRKGSEAECPYYNGILDIEGKREENGQSGKTTERAS